MNGPPRPVIGAARRRRLQDAGLAWYAQHGRRFAFRGTADPYLVLVSEVILQQTQVSRGEPAWLAFTARFPTFAVLARAPTAEVLRAWAGLGYNRRALNLLGAARIVEQRYGGRLPDDLRALEALPGVGPYTARAVAAICFGRPVGPVDTNVRRVLGRLVGGQSLSAAGLQALADALVPAARPAAWTAALMDIGSLFCRPRDPACAACPLRADCATAGRRAPVAAGSGRAAEKRAAGSGLAATPRRAGEARVPYTASRRWLRGRIVDHLRAVPTTEWRRLDGPLGGHDGPAIAAALEGLAHDGLVELDGTGQARLPRAEPASAQG
ncbi:MAG: A/G-specific adenine glycosylase [Candidatus Limnocylindrales bacterium]